MPRYEIIFWNSARPDDDVTTHHRNGRNHAFEHLVNVCRVNSDMVGFVFDTNTNKRIMSIGVGLD